MQSHTLAVPAWVVDGALLAAVISVGIMALASLVYALANLIPLVNFNASTPPWRKLSHLVGGYFLYGLPAGLTITYLWHEGYRWRAGLAGAGVVIALTLLFQLIYRLRR